MKLPIQRSYSSIDRWEPFEEIRRAHEYMEQLFRNFPLTDTRLTADVFSPLTDVMEDEDKITITADLPGTDKEDIKLNVRDNVLEISAGRDTEDEKQAEGYLRKERSYTKYYRQIILPEKVTEDEASAKLVNGVLTVTLPKVKTESKKQIPIE